MLLILIRIDRDSNRQTDYCWRADCCWRVQVEENDGLYDQPAFAPDDIVGVRTHAVRQPSDVTPMKVASISARSPSRTPMVRT